MELFCLFVCFSFLFYSLEAEPSLQQALLSSKELSVDNRHPSVLRGGYEPSGPTPKVWDRSLSPFFLSPLSLYSTAAAAAAAGSGR